MKKLIIISVLLVCVFAAGIAQMQFLNIYFNRISDDLRTIYAIEETATEIQTPDEVCTLMDKTISDLSERRNVIFMLNHHNAVHLLLSQILQAKELAKNNQKGDTLAALSVAIYYSNEIAKDSAVDFPNIL